MSTAWTYRDGPRGNWEAIMVDGERVGEIYKDGPVWNANGICHYTRKRDAAQAVADRNYHRHRISISGRVIGGSPIAGWGPVWGYWVSCTCGYKSRNVAGETREEARHHLSGLGSGDADG